MEFKVYFIPEYKEKLLEEKKNINLVYKFPHLPNIKWNVVNNLEAATHILSDTFNLRNVNRLAYINIVKFEWVENMVIKSQYVPENLYKPDIFEGCQMYFSGRIKNEEKLAYTEIITKYGGKIIETYQKIDKKYKLHILSKGGDYSKSDYKLYRKIRLEDGIVDMVSLNFITKSTEKKQLEMERDYKYMVINKWQIDQENREYFLNCQLLMVGFEEDYERKMDFVQYIIEGQGIRLFIFDETQIHALTFIIVNDRQDALRNEDFQFLRNMKNQYPNIPLLNPHFLIDASLEKAIPTDLAKYNWTFPKLIPKYHSSQVLNPQKEGPYISFLDAKTTPPTPAFITPPKVTNEYTIETKRGIKQRKKLFKHISFCLDVIHQRQDELKDKIENQGGRIKKQLRKAHYLVNELSLDRPPMRTKKSMPVTWYWIEECLRTKNLLNPDSSVFFTPMILLKDGLKIHFSKKQPCVYFSGVDPLKISLYHIIMTDLQAVVETHLSTSIDFVVQGPLNVEERIPENIPRVRSDWITTCYSKGHLVNPNEYLCQGSTNIRTSGNATHAPNTTSFQPTQEIIKEDMDKILELVESVKHLPRGEREKKLNEKYETYKSQKMQSSNHTPDEDRFKSSKEISPVENETNKEMSPVEDRYKSSKEMSPVVAMEEDDLMMSDEEIIDDDHHMQDEDTIAIDKLRHERDAIFEEELALITNLEHENTQHIPDILLNLDETEYVDREQFRMEDEESSDHRVTYETYRPQKDLILHHHQTTTPSSVQPASIRSKSQIIKFDDRTSTSHFELPETSHVICVSGSSKGKYDRGQVEKDIEYLKGEVRQEINSDVTLMVAIELKYTPKVIAAIAGHIPILLPEWIRDSKKENEWQPIDDYLWSSSPNISEKKERFMCDHIKQLAAKDKKVFSDWHLIAYDVNKSFLSILSMGGGTIYDKDHLGPNKHRINRIIVDPKKYSADNTIKQKVDQLCSSLLIPCYNQNFIVYSVIPIDRFKGTSIPIFQPSESRSSRHRRLRS